MEFLLSALVGAIVVAIFLAVAWRSECGESKYWLGRAKHYTEMWEESCKLRSAQQAEIDHLQCDLAEIRLITAKWKGRKP